MKGRVLFIVLTFALSSCFWGPDAYEKDVNGRFFLYSEDYTTSDVCLGTIQAGGERIGDGYLCFIKRIGWDNSFLICETKINGYYIQDLRFLKDKHAVQFRGALYGPFSEETFNQQRVRLGVSQQLNFDISY